MNEYLNKLDIDQLINMALPFASNLVVAAAIYLVGSWLVRRLTGLMRGVSKKRQLDEALSEFVISIISVVLTFIVALIALEQLGLDTTSLLALLGAAGLAVGLALKDSLSNFAAGVMLILFKPFKTGDFVEAAGIAGVVERITIFSTQLRTGDNRQIIVPNSGIYGDVITNFSAKPTRRVDLVIGISYDDNIKQARDIIQTILDQDDRILKDPAPVIVVGELGDSSVNLLVRPWVKTSDYWAVYWHLLETIKMTFDDQGISIPFPQRDVHIYQESQSS